MLAVPMLHLLLGVNALWYIFFLLAPLCLHFLSDFYEKVKTEKIYGSFLIR